MKRGTKEFYEMMDQFERCMKSDKRIYCGSLTRESKDAGGRVYYTDGKVNDLFIAFMLGYSTGRLNYMLEG